MIVLRTADFSFLLIEDFGTLFPETSKRFLGINGQRRPTIDMRPGEVQRWRLVGSQYQDNMLLALNYGAIAVLNLPARMGTPSECFAGSRPNC